MAIWSPSGWLVLLGCLIVIEIDHALIDHTKLTEMHYSGILLAEIAARGGGPTTDETKLKTGPNTEDNKKQTNKDKRQKIKRQKTKDKIKRQKTKNKIKIQKKQKTEETKKERKKT